MLKSNSRPEPILEPQARFLLILNHQATTTTSWMRVKPWTGCG
jgi:hypothetical protein